MTLYDLIVRVPPAVYALEFSYRSLIAPNGVCGHFFYRTVVYRVLAALLGFCKALLPLFIGVLEVANTLKFFRRRIEAVFRGGKIHVIESAVINSVLAGIFVALVDVGDMADEGVGQRRVTEAHSLLEAAAAVKGLGAVGEPGLLSDVQLRHQLSEIRLRVSRIGIQNPLTIFICTLPVAVLQKHKGAIQQCRQICIAAAHDHTLLDRRLGRVRLRDLLDAADQVLHEAELRHILFLQMGKLVRQIIGVHVAVGGDERLFRAVFDECKIAAPLILHPHGVEILRPRAQHHHDLGAVERGENVRLIGHAELVLQRNAAEKDLEALGGELVIEVVGKHAVLRPPSVRVGLLVADKNVKELFLLGNFQNPPLNFVDGLGLVLVNAALAAVRVLQRGFIVVVVEYRGELSAVDGGNASVAGRVLDVFDAVAAKHERPIRLGIGLVLVQNLLIDTHRLVELVVAAEMVRPVIQIRPLLIVKPRQSLLRAAAIAHTDRCTRLKLNRASAHFTFEYRHYFSPLFFLCFFSSPSLYLYALHLRFLFAISPRSSSATADISFPALSCAESSANFLSISVSMSASASLRIGSE